MFSELFNISYYFTAVERFKTIAIRNTIIKLVSMILIFALVKTNNHVWIYTLILVLSDVLGQVINWCSLDKFILKKPKLTLGNFRIMMRVSFSLFLPTVAIQVYTMLDKVMLGVIMGESETGFYENANKLLRLASTVSSAVVAVYIPRMSNDYANNRMETFIQSLKKVFKFVSFLSFPMCCGLMVIAKDFTLLYYGIGFAGIEVLFYIGAIMIISLAWSGVLGNMVLIPSGKQRFYTIAVVSGAGINIVLNCWMIPLWGASGAMIASVLAEVIGMFIMYIYSKKEFKIVGFFHGVERYILASIIMSVVIWMESTVLRADIRAICIEVISGVIIYILCLLLLKDSIVRQVFRFLKQITYKFKR